MHDITIRPYNAVYDILDCDLSIQEELHDYFTFKVPNYHFMRHKSEKLKKWSGEIRLFNRRQGTLYTGLRERLFLFAKDREYQVNWREVSGDTEFSAHEAVEFIKSLNLPHMPREYQFKAFLKAVRKKRLLVLSPTASGKSLLIYMLLWWIKWQPFTYKLLLIVPTVNLVHQMLSDFESYGCKTEEWVHVIYEGQEKFTDKPIIISTWQSIFNLPKKWFSDINAIVVDEAHHAQAKSLKRIMEMATNTYWRIGLTGTLDDSLTHRLTLEGLFGPVYQATTTKKLMEQKHISQMQIKTILLRYPTEICKTVSKMDYQTEIEFLALNNSRNNFIKNLILSLKENTLVLYRFVDKHGKILFDDLNKLTDRPVYYISGEVDGEERENIRRILDEQQNAILLGSYGTVSTGINIPSLRNIIFASPYKSRIKVLQSIGRGLRKTDTKDQVTVFDIADDFTYKKHQNFTLEHYMQRIKLYNEQEFLYRTYEVELK